MHPGQCSEHTHLEIGQSFGGYSSIKKNTQIAEKVIFQISMSITISLATIQAFTALCAMQIDRMVIFYHITDK